MKYRDVQQQAKKMGLKCSGIKKADMIRSIQSAERNETCFASDRTSCDQKQCCWVADCVTA